AVARSGIDNLNGVLGRAEPLVALSVKAESLLRPLEAFLLERFYHHEQVVAAAQRAREGLTELFRRFCADPGLMPGYYRRFIAEHGLQRVVCDYIAGMTDRFCLRLLG
ncbi:MAG TPA: deoxyguanosinetriphosphate triphosphohydrolase, partial [Phycisphaerales bacterium]|nr:deoxyguanosinetriphosphate triphosphohydrolase [Phycisphaerales bacterium]